MAASPRAKRLVRSAAAKMSSREKGELAALARMPDSAIGASDISENTDWSKVQVGRFYRPIKRSVDHPPRC